MRVSRLAARGAARAVAILAGVWPLLMGLAVSTALAHGGGGGGGHATYVYIYVPSGPPPALYAGDEAAMALAVTDAPPMVTEGDIRLGDVIAEQQVRAADAIVTTANIQGKRRIVPAGTVLVRAAFANPDLHAAVWCDIRPTGFPPRMRDCFQDSQGAGQLDKLWQADFVGGDFLGFGMSGLTDTHEALPTPAPYRHARPEELPIAFIAYKYCDGDGVVSPPRFRVVAGKDADPSSWRLMSDCRAGLWNGPADKSQVDADALRLTVTPIKGGIHFRVVRTLPPGPITALVRQRAVRSLSDAAGPAADAAAPDLGRQPALVPAGATTLATGQIDIGQAFLVGPVRYGLTGHLLIRVRPTLGLFWPAGTWMDVGQAVFGVPSNGPGDGMAWCAANQKPTGWETDCLEPVSDAYMRMTSTTQGYYWLAKLKPIWAPTRLALDMAGEGDPASSDPAVALGPIDGVPALTASVKLARVHPKSKTDASLVYDIDVDLDAGEGEAPINRVSLSLPPEGQPIRVMGHIVLLQPGQDDTHMLVSTMTATPSDPKDIELLSVRPK